jgi:hypothetical protein
LMTCRAIIAVFAICGFSCRLPMWYQITYPRASARSAGSGG